LKNIIGGSGIEVTSQASTLTIAASGVITTFQASITANASAITVLENNLLDVSTITAGFSTSAGTAGQYIRACNATQMSVTVTAGPGLHPVGTQITVRQVGAGSVVFVEDTGVVINASTLFLRGVHSTGTLIMVASGAGAGIWDLVGDLANS
jgi:hypothetical protein